MKIPNEHPTPQQMSDMIGAIFRWSEDDAGTFSVSLASSIICTAPKQDRETMLASFVEQIRLLNDADGRRVS